MSESKRHERLSQRCVRIRFDGRIVRFVLPSVSPSHAKNQELSEQLRLIIFREFGVDTSVAATATLSYTIRNDNANGNGNDEMVVVPLDVSVLENASPSDELYDLNTYLTEPVVAPAVAAMGMAMAVAVPATDVAPHAATATTTSTAARASRASVTSVTTATSNKSNTSTAASSSSSSSYTAARGTTQTLAVAGAPAKRKARVEDLKPNTVRCLYAYNARTSTELSFKAGDIIEVEGQYDKDWWKGQLNGEDVGFFPANFVEGLDRVVLLDPEPSSATGVTTNGDHDEKKDKNFQDPEYFDSYATLVIHHQMLSDRARTEAYHDAVQRLRPHIEGKIVLDVGCGSGILSCFCARAGAAHVYAVDASDIIKIAAAKVVKENGLSDRITLINGKIEEIKLPVEKVDVIISEWMGTFLVCESMIESALLARSMYLRPGGIMMPSSSSLTLSLLSMDEYYDKRIGYFKDVYGFKMTSLQPKAKLNFFEKPVYAKIIKPEHVASTPERVWLLDMANDSPDVLESHTGTFKFVMRKSGRCHGFASWFDVHFGVSHAEIENSLVLSTSPWHMPTHWKQVLFFLQDPLQLVRGAVVTGSITIKRNSVWRRHFEATLSFSAPIYTESEVADGIARETAANPTPSAPIHVGPSATATATTATATISGESKGVESKVSVVGDHGDGARYTSYMSATAPTSSTLATDAINDRLLMEQEIVRDRELRQSVADKDGAAPLARQVKEFTIRYDMWR